jgi:hypothetical protein
LAASSAVLGGKPGGRGRRQWQRLDECSAIHGHLLAFVVRSDLIFAQFAVFGSNHMAAWVRLHK